MLGVYTFVYTSSNRAHFPADFAARRELRLGRAGEEKLVRWSPPNVETPRGASQERRRSSLDEMMDRTRYRRFVRPEVLVERRGHTSNQEPQRKCDGLSCRST